VEPRATANRHDDFQQLLGAFALGAVDADEAAALRAHLATCAECQAELGAMWLAVGTLPMTIEPMDPPPALRSRIEAAILAESPPQPAAPRQAPTMPPPTPIRRPDSWWSRAAPWAAAAAILLVVSAALLAWNLRLQDQLRGTMPQTVALAPTDAAPGASGEVRYLPESDLFVLDVRDLPPLAPGEVYEVWLIGAEGPVPAGVFDQPTDTHAIVADRGQFQAIAITNEPGPVGTAAPTGRIVAQAAL
jgi:anti-sigma-K factor RskA